MATLITDLGDLINLDDAGTFAGLNHPALGYYHMNSNYKKDIIISPNITDHENMYPGTTLGLYTYGGAGNSTVIVSVTKRGIAVKHFRHSADSDDDFILIGEFATPQYDPKDDAITCGFQYGGQAISRGIAIPVIIAAETDEPTSDQSLWVFQFQLSGSEIVWSIDLSPVTLIGVGDLITITRDFISSYSEESLAQALSDATAAINQATAANSKATEALTTALNIIEEANRIWVAR